MVNTLLTNSNSSICAPFFLNMRLGTCKIISISYSTSADVFGRLSLEIVSNGGSGRSQLLLSYSIVWMAMKETLPTSREKASLLKIELLVYLE